MIEDGAKSAGKPMTPRKERFLRARSLPSRRSYDTAAFLSAIHYLGIIATATALVSFIRQPSELATKIIIGGIIFSAITWFTSFLKRRATFCPLCKGTPLINSGAHTHSKAIHLFPFNHGTTATLSIIATQRFRCMYCGSDFDLLKPPSHLLVGGKTSDEAR